MSRATALKPLYLAPEILEEPGHLLSGLADCLIFPEVGERLLPDLSGDALVTYEVVVNLSVDRLCSYEAFHGPLIVGEISKI